MFYEYWLSVKAPVYIIRYEDLLNEPGETLEELFKYLLKSQDYTDSSLYKRLKEVTTRDKPAREIYKPRKKIINGSQGKYSAELRNYIT